MKLDKCLSAVVATWQSRELSYYGNFDDPPGFSLVAFEALHELALRDDLAQLPDETRLTFGAYFIATNIEYSFCDNADLARRGERALWVWADSRAMETEFTGTLVRDLEAR